MQRLSIARSLRLALVGLTLALAIVAAFGVATLYKSRQRYENRLLETSALSTAAANLAGAGVAEDEALRDTRGPRSAGERAKAQATYLTAAHTVSSLAMEDPPSRVLAQKQIAAETRARRLAANGQYTAATAPDGPLNEARTLATQLQARQLTRQQIAHANARSDAKRAIIMVGIAGLLALVGALTLIALLIRGMRRPLDDLVQATRSLAAGKLEPPGRAVRPAGAPGARPAFNAMADDLRGAQRRIEEERRALAVTIESLGDALIVTEPGSSKIAAVNPRATELVPELVVGDRLPTAMRARCRR